MSEETENKKEKESFWGTNLGMTIVVGCLVGTLGFLQVNPKPKPVEISEKKYEHLMTAVGSPKNIKVDLFTGHFAACPELAASLKVQMSKGAIYEPEYIALIAEWKRIAKRDDEKFYPSKVLLSDSLNNRPYVQEPIKCRFVEIESLLP